MEGTRLAIVQLLQRRNKATVEQMSQALALASATIRRHLDILQRDGLVEYERVRNKPGRPEYAYHLTEAGQEALPKDYKRLLSLVLREIRELPPSELADLPDQNHLTDRLLSRIARRVASEYEHSNHGQPAATLTERAHQATAVLEKEQFLPQIEQSDDAVRIRLLNCPFRSIALEDDAVCSFDAYLIARLTGSSVTRECCVSHGAHSCVYRLDDATPP